ncbi:unnamed protein product, partial [Timema podura]|nr:unnamed protein product [Timema podura]
DIAQQELCDHQSVGLVEQCARFHIHCSGRLLAEDPSVFDEKINTENLTKCLQTLKYMYDDLALNNHTCPNEAEFRGYMILLNLNDDNFIWDINHLRPEIRHSAEVKFALSVHSAIKCNNYVRFFKLVRQTSYLNACVLERYFFQVRSWGLLIIIDAHCHLAKQSLETRVKWRMTPELKTLRRRKSLGKRARSAITCIFLLTHGHPHDVRRR